MDFQNLEKAIDILTNPIGIKDESIKKEANDFLISFVSNNFLNWRGFFDYFCQAQSDSAKYWILQALWDIVNNHWRSLSIEEQANLANSAYEFVVANSSSIIPVNYFCKKYAYFYSMIIKQTYPEQWNSVFTDLIKLIQESGDNIWFVIFLFAVLEAINDEIIEREAYTTKGDISIANRIKDGMRREDTERISEICKTVLDNWDTLDKDMVIGAIDTVADLIDWNDLTIFENCYLNITKMLDSKDFQQNALYWFYSFMHKGMDPGKKIELIKEINIIDKIKGFSLDQDDIELWQSISDIISKLGLLILEIVETSDSDTVSYFNAASELMIELLVLNIMFLEWNDIKSSQFIVRFVNAAVLYLKKFTELSETLAEIMTKIQDVWICKIQHPDDFKFEEGKFTEDEENFILLREDLVNLFSNTLLMPSMKKRACDILLDKFTALIGNEVSFTVNQIELPLFLLSQMHQIIMRDDKDLTSTIYKTILNEFLEVDFLSINDKNISILYFEVWVKFASFFVIYPSRIPSILDKFMSEKGVLSSWRKLSSRSSYFLLRFIDRLKPQLNDWANQIFERAKEVIDYVESNETHLLSSDIENFYEIVGNIFEGFQMDTTVIRETLSTYFTLIYDKLKSLPDTAAEGRTEFLRRLNVLVKSLNSKNSSECKDLFIAMVTNIYPFFKLHIDYRTFRDAFTVFFQKSLTIVGSNLFEWAENYIETLLSIKSLDCLDWVMKFANFITIELDESALSLVEKYAISIIYKQIETIEFPSSNKSDEEKDIINIFLKYSRLLQTCTQKNSLILIGPNSVKVFESIIKFLIYMMKQNVDKNLRKDALLIIRTMLIEFSGWNLPWVKMIHIGDKTKIEERKIIDNPDYFNIWKYLVEEVSKEIFQVFQYLNLSDPIDGN